MKFILVLVSLVVAGKTCKSKTSPALCIDQRIEQIKKEPKWNPPAEVNEYSYNGQQVFLFSSNCCDRYNEVYDKDCKYVCSPSGGFTGKGDNACSDFFQKAKHVRLVWKDDR